MHYKLTTKLFHNRYQYKIVSVCPGAAWFRSGDMDKALTELSQVKVFETQKVSGWRSSNIRSKEDLEYAIKLATVISTLSDISLRVESPWLTIYSNSRNEIDAIANIDINKIKYISEPPATGIAVDTVIMPKMNFDFRVTIGKTNQPNPAFIEWASSNKKCKLTKSCIRELEKQRSWGGSHFYITGNNNLLLAKMHLGGSISKIERIIKA